MMVFKLLLFAVLCVASLASYTPDWSSLDARPIPSWYEDAKFGIFIHWGVFSVPSYGSEHFWYLWKHKHDPRYVEFMKKNYPPNFQYQDFAPMFKAELWDPVKWATLFKKSGAKYIAFTSKHHEGWTNWPSKYSWNWNSVDLGPHRDIVGELAEAIRKNTDIHFGLYYSLLDFFHPLYLEDHDENNCTTQNYVNEVMIPQLQEIIIGYHPELIWSDGDWTANDTYWNSKQFLTWLYNDSPVKDTVVVNDRWGIGSKCAHGGYYTCRNLHDPSYQAHKWENYYPMQGHVWGYDRNMSIDDYATAQTLVSILVQTVSCNGNLLLNVGPTHDGRITPIFEERLLQIGSWLEINGEAIYGSRPWTHQNDTTTSSLWYTVSGDGKNVYAILVEWPKDGSVILGAFKGTSKPHSVKMLGYDGSISYTVQSEGLHITLPVLLPNTELQWAWSLKISM